MADNKRKRDYSVEEPEDAIAIYKEPRKNSDASNTGLTVYQYHATGPTLAEQLVNRAANYAFERGTQWLEGYFNRKRPAEEQLVPEAPAKRVTTTTTSTAPRRSSAPIRKVTRTTVTMPRRSVKYSRKSAKRYFKKATKKTGTRAREYFGHTVSATSRSAGEYKYLDSNYAATALTNTGFVSQLDQIGTGDTTDKRDGQHFTVTKVRIRGYFRSGTTTGVAYAVCMLVWDYEPKGTLAAITEILDANSPNSLPNRDNQARFRILKRWVMTFAGNAATPATGREVAYIDEYLKMPPGLTATCTKTDTTGAIGNRVEGTMLFVYFSDVVAGTTAPVMNTTIRLNFRE